MRLAVVRELRAPRAEDGRRAAPRPAARHTLRPRRAARRGRPADEDRLHLPPEQPDRDDEQARRARRVPRARARATCSRCSTRRTSSTSTSRTIPDAIAEYVRAGRRVVVLRTFSKIYGLAGLRVGYGVAPEDDRHGARARCAARSTSRSPAQDGRAREPRRRRRSSRARRALNAEGRAELERILRAAGLEPVGPAVGELPLRRDRRGRARVLRGAAPRGRDRPAAGRLRRAGRGPDHGRHAREHAFLAAALARVGTPARCLSRDWDADGLAAGVRAGDRRALARAITLVEAATRSPTRSCARSIRTPARAYAVGLTGPAGGGEVEPHRRAPARAAPGRPLGRRAVGRPDEPVHARGAARRPDPPDRPLPRPGGLHPLDGRRAAISAGCRRRRSSRCSFWTRPERT